MKQYKPTTPSRRGMTTVPYRNVLTRSAPEKSLTHGFKRSVGRNNAGRITTRHKGSGHKRLYREIYFSYDKKDIPASILSVEYDPNRTGFVGLAVYKDGEKRYVLLPKGVRPGHEFVVSERAEVKIGNRMALKNIPVGAFVFNVEIHQGGGARTARSGGIYAQVVAHEGGYAQIKMPASEIRKVNAEAYATIGEVSNNENRLVNIGKAGRSRWLGIRPTVRGSAMNPVDHPH